MLAIGVFLSGFLNILYAFFPQRRWIFVIERFVPLEIENASRTLTIITGFFLIALAGGLWQRKWRAWLFSVVVLTASLVFRFTRGVSAQEVFVIVPLVLLLIFRLQFKVRSAQLQFFQKIMIAIVLLGGIFLYSVAGFFLLQGQFFQRVNWSTISQDYEYSAFGIGRDSLVPRTRRARWFEDSISTVSFVVLLSIFAGLFAPSLFSPDITEEDLRRVRRYAIQYGTQSISYFALMEDKKYFFSKNRLSVIAYIVQNGTAVVLGIPLGPPEEREQCVQEFIASVQSHGLKILWYFLDKNDVAPLQTIGMKSLQIGEEALVNVQTFSLEGSSMKNLRNAVTHIEKEQMTFLWFTMDNLPWNIQVGIDGLHQQWLDHRKTVSLTFSMDFYPFPDEKHGVVGVAFSKHGLLLGACSFFPYNKHKALSLDIMIKDRHAPNGTLETLLVKSFQQFRERGVEEVSLGLAALTHLEQLDYLGRTQQETLPEKAMRLLKERFKHFYDYQSLASFKNKFQPRWEPRYLAYTNNHEFIQEVSALIQAHTQTTILAMLKR